MVLGIEASHANKPDRTGVEEYCFQIIQEFKKIIPADVRVVLYSNEPLRNGLEIMPGNWEAKVLRWPLKKLWSQTRLAWELLFHPPDVFFAPGQLIPFITPRRTIAMIHDSAFVACQEAYRFWSRQYLRFMNWLIIRKSIRLLTSSSFNKIELEKFYGRSATEKTAVIPLGFDRKRFHSGVALESAALAKNFGVTKPFIMTTGRLEAKKNTRRLIEAFDIIKKQHDIQLVLVGKPGYGYEAAQAALEQSPYKKDIIVPGYVEQHDLPWLVASARVFVFPSAYEGFGIPVLEAMACGTPTIASRVGPLPEVAGAAARYFDPADVADLVRAATALLEDDNERARLRSLGFERVALFSWEKTAAATWGVIVKVLWS
ncbi:MAG: glycosyltransferase family 4 protein [Candidatus Magasanikbacteria bacterium]|nr:glycosyltransferase family 4 protein [Candidatus Magasanikbacteria bacterium]